MVNRTRNDDWAVIAAVLLVLLISTALFVAMNPKPKEKTAVDLGLLVLPPDEFAVGEERAPARNLSAEELARTSPFHRLKSRERRTIYNAVMYYCNEEQDTRACNAFLKYCGTTCGMLVRKEPAPIAQKK